MSNQPRRGLSKLKKCPCGKTIGNAPLSHIHHNPWQQRTRTRPHKTRGRRLLSSSRQPVPFQERPQRSFYAYHALLIVFCLLETSEKALLPFAPSMPAPSGSVIYDQLWHIGSICTEYKIQKMFYCLGTTSLKLAVFAQ